MTMRLGIGPTRETAKWCDGRQFDGLRNTFRVSIGNSDDTLLFIWHLLYDNQYRDVIGINGYGKIFVDFLGTDDAGFPETDGERSFDISDFEINITQYSREMDPVLDAGYPTWNTEAVYKSTNNNSVREEWAVDCIFASDNWLGNGHGILINPDGTKLTTMSFAGGEEMYAEQHLADRVTAFWATSKRRLQAELRSNVSIGNNIVVGDINPQFKLTLDSTTGYPIAISHDWRDDVIKLVILEL